MSRVRSASVASILDTGTTPDGEPWYATTYIPGPTLQRQVRDSGALPPGWTEALAVGLAEALAAIHEAGVVHRDLKPANVILAPDGPKVLDFGIARAVDESAITGTGSLVGSPGWMSPERFRGHVGPEADVFAWGALVAYAATGRPPFGTGGVETLMYRVLNEEPDLAGLPAELTGPLSRALAKDPAARPTAIDLVPLTANAYGASYAGDAADVAATVIQRNWEPAPQPSALPEGGTVPLAPPVRPPAPLPDSPPRPVRPERPSTPAAGTSRRRGARAGVVAGVCVTLLAGGAGAFVILSDGGTPVPDGGENGPGQEPAEGSVGEGPTLERLSEEGVVRVAVGDYAPYSFVDGGEAAGISPALAGAVFEGLGIPEIEPVAIDPAAMLLALETEEVDVVASDMVITPERCDQVAFSDPYSRFATAFLVESGDPEGIADSSGNATFATFADSGATLGVVGGGPEEEAAADAGIAGDALEPLADRRMLMGALANGDVDAVAADAIGLRWMLEEGGTADDYELTMPFASDAAGEQFTGLAFRDDDPKLVDAVNERLDELRASGGLLAAVADYGVEEEDLPSPDTTAEDACAP